MFLGALIDLGVPETVVADAVAALGLDGVTVETRPGRRGGVAGLRFRVLVDGWSLEGPEPDDPPHTARTEGPPDRGRPGPERVSRLDGVEWEVEEVRELLRASPLEPKLRKRAGRLVGRLAEALAFGAGTGVEEVRFTGLPGVDFLVDLVGAAAAVEHLAPARITCGRVNVGGRGEPVASSGEGAVPRVVPGSGPAAGSLRLLEGAPLESRGGGERVTPTGAVLLAELVDSFEPLPSWEPDAVGYGLGRYDTPDRPNVVRVLRGRAPAP